MTGTEAGLRPARGYSWPPFDPGNEAALKHGAKSVRKVQPIADALLVQLRDAAPWVASPVFAGAAASWAYAEGQAALLRLHLDSEGALDDEGGERSAARLLDRVEGRLAKLRDQLGLTPQALAKLLSTTADVATTTGDEATLEALKLEGSKILAARLSQRVGEPAALAADSGSDDEEVTS